MKKLVIDNIGPINHVVLNLKRVNVLIGPQSAGKSCILKIACFCAWAEKRIQLVQGQNGFSAEIYLKENLIDFHKLEGYFEDGKKARFRYDTSHLWLEYNHDSREFKWDWKQAGHWKYKRSKVSYIPAERNLIAAIPNWMEVSMGFDYVRNFISDWNLVRQYYEKSNALNLFSLGIKYYYDKKAGKDYIVLEDGKELEFTNGSSGIQSAIPMMAYLDFLFNNQYKGGQLGRIAVESENEDILNHIYETKFKRGLKTFLKDNVAYVGKIGIGKRLFKSEKEFAECKHLLESYTKTWYSDIYLEEPEQNLFPQTQVELVYTLLKNIQIHGDNLFIATHSPYILYAINNCMMGYLVKDKIGEDNKALRRNSDYWFSPKEVAVWEIKDGNVVSEMDVKSNTIQDAEGLIRGNYFDRVMKLIMADFTNYSVYYD